MGTQNAGSVVQWKPTSLPEVQLGTDTILAKTDFFGIFLANWLSGSTLKKLRQTKEGQRVAPLVTALPPALN